MIVLRILLASACPEDCGHAHSRQIRYLHSISIDFGLVVDPELGLCGKGRAWTGAWSWARAWQAGQRRCGAVGTTEQWPWRGRGCGREQLTGCRGNGSPG